jgi:Mrp family chromosome partitioning ATPase
VAASLRPIVPPTTPPAESEAHRPRRICADALAQAGLISCGVDRRAAEEFRIVQSKVIRQSLGVNGVGRSNRDNLVMVTSALQGEGKSFCAINLAGEVARQGDRKVLLVDADPKPNGLAQLLGASGEPGLIDLVRDKRIDFATIAIPTEADNLEILPFGTNGDGSGELFASRRMGEAIDELNRCNPDRLIIFDAPPCLGSSTPHTLASVVGQAILVVAAGSTQETDVEAALELLEPCPHVSLLLNKVPTWLTHSFGAYAYPATQA